MQKYIRGLLYGNKKTKCYLWFLIILFVLTVVTAFCAIAAHSVESGIVAVFAGVLGLVIASSFSFQTIEYTEETKKGQSVEKDNEKRTLILDIKNQEEKNRKEKESGERQYFHQYNEKKLQSILKEHKVKKVNAPAMVDYSKKYKIRECPAYIWCDKSNFYVLLLEKQTRKISIPLNTLKYIQYQPGVQADVEKDYQDFQRSSFIGKMFGEFLPTYYHGKGKEAYFYKKNLYSISSDIHFTNTSARNLMKILNLNVNIKHPSLDKEEYAQYYQLLYQYNILWKDGVITIEEYQDKIKLQLKSMADSIISAKEYNIMIMKFIKYRWITEEYAKFFMGYKEKVERNKLERKK